MDTSRLFVDTKRIRLLNVMGATTITFGFIKNDDGNPLTIVLSKGKLLRREKFQLMQDQLVALCNDIGRAVVIGRMDIVAQQEYEEQGMFVKFVDEFSLWSNPKRVREDITRFITA